MTDLPPLPINLANWYWFVGEDRTKVFSSKSGDYVALNDADYLTWKAINGIERTVATESEIGVQLAAVSARPTHAVVLDAYKDEQARELTIKTIAKAVFFLYNEVRALKGQQPVNAVQFRQVLKDLM